MGGRVGSVLRGVVIAVALILGTSACGKERRVEGTEERIRADMPIGSSVDQAIAYLDKRGIEHSGYVAAERIVDAIHRGGTSGLVNKSVRIRLSFDADRRLRSIETREQFTGP